MSCEKWRELLDAGDPVLREGSPERRRAERHFAACASCAQRAFLIDPSWALRDHDDGGGEFSTAELKALKISVLAGGRARALEDLVKARPRRLRAAAAVALLAALVAGFTLFGTVGSLTVTTDLPSAPEASQPSSLGVEPAVAVTGSGASLPAVGPLAPAAARIYDFGEEDFALVMVVHETLDL